MVSVECAGVAPGGHVANFKSTPPCLEGGHIEYKLKSVGSYKSWNQRTPPCATP
jgi:hypothetical protein